MLLAPHPALCTIIHGFWVDIHCLCVFGFWWQLSAISVLSVVGFWELAFHEVEMAHGTPVIESTMVFLVD